MTISSGVAFLLSTSPVAGTTAAKAALTRIVFGMGAIATAFIATMALRFRRSAVEHNGSHTLHVMRGLDPRIHDEKQHVKALRKA